MPNYAQAAIQIRQNKERRAKEKEILRARNMAVSSLLRERTTNQEKFKKIYVKLIFRPD